jgi:hypothetical protein
LTVALVFVIIFQLFAYTDVDGASRREFLLSLEPSAPRLPADGGKYSAVLQLQTPDKRPVQAPFDIEIDLLSSDPAVVSLPNRVVMKEGQTFVKVDLLTTEKAGEVTISGLGAGIAAATGKVKTTRTQGLEPTKLDVYSHYTSVLPDARFVGKLYIQLLNAQNLPAPAKTPIEVTISSGDTDVVSVPGKVIIAQGTTGEFVDFTPGIKSGSTRVTASASGLASGKVDIRTVDLVGEKIAIDIAPDVIPATKGSETTATIQLVDSRGSPVKPSKSVSVFLKSSNDTIATVEENVVIDPGRSYVRTTIVAQGRVGDAEITAFTSGYESAKAKIKAVEPATQGEKLVLYISPKLLPPDNTAHDAVLIQIQDKGGRPYTPRAGELEILLTSSSTEIGVTEEQVDFVSNRHYAITKFTTRFVVGKTTITAAVTGYASATKDLEVRGPEPISLVLSQIPTIMEADGQVHEAVVVQLLDDRRNPVPAPRETPVDLTSSLTEVVTIDPVVTIPEGQTYAIARIRTTQESGKSVITASAQGLVSDPITFSTYDSLTQNKLSVYVVPEKLPADGDTYEAAVVQHQDRAGNPTPATSDIAVVLSSSSMIAGSIDRSVVIPAGSTFATANFTTTTKTDRVEITASAQGFKSVTGLLETTLQTLTVTTSAIPRRFVELNNVPVEVTVVSGDLPVKGAFVQLTGTGADISTAVTDENGRAKVTFIPIGGGASKIDLTVSKKGYTPVVRNLSVSVNQPLNITIKAITDGGREIEAKVTVQPPAGKLVSQDAKPNKPVVLKDVNPGIYTITVPLEIKAKDGRYKFEGWSDGVADNRRQVNVAFDSSLAAVYSADYLLMASSPYGTISGIGWYPEGGRVALSIAPTSVSEFIIDRHFAGWSGDVKSDVATVNVVMDSPKSVTAEWKDDYTKLIGIAGGGAGAAGFFFYRRFKENGFGKKEKPPDLDWFKSG